MNAIDFTILYFACGAPFAVYFYLQNRFADQSNYLRLKTFAAFVFWVPFAFRVFYQTETFARLLNKLSGRDALIEENAEEKIYAVEKKIENVFLQSNSDISLFEFRQVIERYAGLSLAQQNSAVEYSAKEREIFRVAGEKDTEIAAVCLRRRNRKLLEFHQTEARRDFLKIIEGFYSSMADSRDLEISTIEFADLLGDSAVRDELKKLFAANLQTRNKASVQQLEKVLWKPEIPEPLHTKSIITRWRMPVAAANSRSKD